MNYIWDRVYEHRWSWAKGAEAEFKQNLQKVNIDEYLLKEDTTDITIGVYGPTQVGKTTLILRLLGVRQKSIEKVNEWLRGKRKQGYSATVTATEYKKSYNDKFHFFSKESGWKRQLTGEELEQVLYDVRNLVEEQGEISTDRMIIEIANTYFDESQSSVSLNFIDLPGVQSAEKSEQLQVQKCVKYWLPICELTLLVDDATLINDYAQIKDNNIHNWMYELDRFRIVPTHSLTLESLLLELHGDISKDGVRSYYAKELSRSLNWKVDANELENILYPIDIGRSLQKMKVSNPNLFDHVYPMMEDILQELRSDLISQKPEGLHFKRLATIYSKAEKQKQVELAQISNHVEKIELDIHNRRTFILRLEKKQQRVIKDIKDLINDQTIGQKMVQSTLENILELEWEKDLEQSFKRIKNAKRASAVNLTASAYQLEWETKVEEIIDSVHKIMSSTKISVDIKVPTTDEKIYYLDKLIDFYVFQSNYDKDLNYVKKKTRAWITMYMSKVITLVEGIIEHLQKDIRELEKKIELHLQKHGLEYSSEEQKLQKLEQRKNDLIIQREQTECEWQQELEHCQALENYFKKNAVMYFQSLKTMLKQGTTTSKWEAQHLLFLLEKDSEMVIRYLKGRE